MVDGKSRKIQDTSEIVLTRFTPTSGDLNDLILIPEWNSEVVQIIWSLFS